MSSSSGSKTRRRKGVTRRVKDSQGNIVVKQYKRRETRFKNPLKLKHIPQIIIGLPLLAYGAMAYFQNQGAFANSAYGTPGYTIEYIFNSYAGSSALFLAGTFAAAIGIILGYTILIKGFKIKKWPSAWRTLFALMAVFVVISAIISPLTNELDIGQRNLNDEDYLTGITGDYDLSLLDSPFYSEFLDGLLNLIGNIPDPSLIVANVTPADGESFDPDSDRYLWRWEVADTYDQDKNDFIQGYEDALYDLYPTALDDTLPADQTKAFRISQQLLTFTTAYQQSIITPWHSELGAQIGQVNDFQYNPQPSSVSVIEDRTNGWTDINEQPGVDIFLSEAGASGSFSYDGFWTAEDKSSIMTDSIEYADLEDILDALDSSADDTRFNEYDNYNQITDIWGEGALPGGSGDTYQGNDYYAGEDGFSTAYNEFLQLILQDPTISIYDLAFMIYNQVSTRLITDLLNQNIEINAASEDAQSQAGTVDKAYFYYNAIANDGSYGIQDMLVGFTHMLRAFNIPSRIVLGFSVGNVADDLIQITMGHIHSWVEVLLPYDLEGDVHYAWGVFNPIPDPYIFLQNGGELEYGRNSLGGEADLTLKFDSGVPTTMPNGLSIEGKNEFTQFDFTSDVSATASVQFDTIAGSNQAVSLRLLNDSDIPTNGQIDPTTILDLGLDLGTIITNSTGNATITLNATRSGVLYIEHDDGSLTNLTQTQDAVVSPLNPLGTMGSYGIQILLAMYGLDYDIILFAWVDNSTLGLEADLPVVTVPTGVGTETVDAIGLILGEEVEFTATAENSGTGEKLEGINNIYLMVMDTDTFSSLQNDIATGQVSQSTLDQYSEDQPFSTTNSSGMGDYTFSFDASYTEKEFYAVVAYIQGTGVYASMIAYLTDSVTINNINFEQGDYLGRQHFYVNDTEHPVKYNITIHAQELDTDAVTNPVELATVSAFTTRNAAGIGLEYYIMKLSYFEDNVYGQTFADYLSATVGCSTSPGIGNCFYMDPDNPNDYFNYTEQYDLDAGITQAMVTITNDAFGLGQYVIVIGTQDYEYFTNTTFFVVLSPPAYAADIDYKLPLDIFQVDTFKNHNLQSLEKELLIQENNFIKHVIIGGLIISIRRFEQ
ncbi:MAG: transglutaminase domain-containing protein [Candidatus Heimdallarchaeota archaeon]|nr:transglutaminase domain-containing protein [Candidatus Heimdallarchaeota archaeon]